MITGIIAAIILIAVLPPAINNGETAVVIMAIVIAALLLLFGMVSRESDRAYNNFVDYWANGGSNRKKQRTRDRRQEARDAVKAEREWKRKGALWTEGDAYCPGCGGKIGLAAKITENGKKKNLYMCTKCGRTYKGNALE